MRRVGVEHAIFFGSRERGDERPHSDLNLILLDDRFERQGLATSLQQLQAKWRSDVHVELLPCSPEQFSEMQEWNPLAREAAARGLPLHIDLSEEEQSP